MIEREAFLKATTSSEVIALPSLGDVRVRGLTRAEAVGLQDVKDNPRALECRIIALGLVEPALSAADVEAWYESADAGHTDLIVDAVQRLSGLGKGADKSGVSGVRNRRRA